MFARVIRLMPKSFKTFALAAGVVLVALTFTAGVGLADGVILDGSPSPVANPAGIPKDKVSMCDVAVEQFYYNHAMIGILLSKGLPQDHPDVDYYSDQMWLFWNYAENVCGIDIHV